MCLNPSKRGEFIALGVQIIIGDAMYNHIHS